MRVENLLHRPFRAVLQRENTNGIANCALSVPFHCFHYLLGPIRSNWAQNFSMSS